MAHKEMKTMMQGALVLTFASFLTKILSAVYRVPFQNLVGNEGFYVYQQIYPIYGIAMTLALTGLPQFISKIVAEQPNQEKEKSVMQQLFPVVFILSLFCWLFFFFGSGLVAHLMGDKQLRPLIQVVSFSFVLIPFSSFYRGSFQGHLLMAPSGVSQVMEQVVRVIVILIAAYFLQLFDWSVYRTSTLAMAGAVIGGVVSTCILWYHQKKSPFDCTVYLFRWTFTDKTKELVKRLIIEGGLVSFYSAFLVIFQLVDSFVIKNALVENGMNDLSAKIEKGIYDRGQPLVQLGLVVALALNSSFLPTLTKYFVKKESTPFSKVARMFLRITTAISLTASCGLAILLPYVNFTLFKDFNGNEVLSLYVFGIALIAVIQAYQSILQSQSQFLLPLLAALSGLAFKAGTTHVLTKLLGITGASLATILGLVLTISCLAFFSKKEINAFMNENDFLKKYLLCLVVMVSVLFIYRWGIFILIGPVTHRLLAMLYAVIGVFLGASVFIYMVIKSKLFTVREWLSLPFGKKILQLKR